MVLLAAIPKARDRTTTARNPGFFRRPRIAKRISARTISNTLSILMFAIPPGETGHLYIGARTSAPRGGVSCGLYAIRRIERQIVPKSIDCTPSVRQFSMGTLAVL